MNTYMFTLTHNSGYDIVEWAGKWETSYQKEACLVNCSLENHYTTHLKPHLNGFVGNLSAYQEQILEKKHNDKVYAV